MWDGLSTLSFDLDDTLWEVGPVLSKAEARLVSFLAEHYPRLAELHEPDAARARRLAVVEMHPERAHDLSFVRIESLRRMAEDAGYPHAVAERAFEVFYEARNVVEPYAEVPGALSALAARYRLVALTNGNADVRRTPLGVHFSHGVSPVDAGCAKPDRRIFEHLFSVTGVPAGRILHVGDDPVTDVGGARAAGCRTVWVNRRGLEWPSHLPRADAEVRDLTELESLLRGA